MIARPHSDRMRREQNRRLRRRYRAKVLGAVRRDMRIGFLILSREMNGSWRDIERDLVAAKGLPAEAIREAAREYAVADNRLVAYYEKGERAESAARPTAPAPAPESAGPTAKKAAGIPESFLGYLERQGFEVPRLLRHPEIDRTMGFCPFGWSPEAIAINEAQESPAEHPRLEIVRRANARAFSAELERQHFGEPDTARSFRSLAALREWLAAQEDSADGWMVKAEHANAGLGNRHLRSRRLDGADTRFVEDLLAAGAQAHHTLADHVDAADVLALLDQDGAGGDPEAGRVAEGLVEQADHALLDLVVGGDGVEEEVCLLRLGGSGPPGLLDAFPRPLAVLRREARPETVELAGGVLDEEGDEAGHRHPLQPVACPGGAQHALDGTRLEGLVDASQ